MPSRVHEIQSVLLPKKLKESFISPLMLFETDFVFQNKTYPKYAVAETIVMKNKKCFIFLVQKKITVSAKLRA